MDLGKGKACWDKFKKFKKIQEGMIQKQNGQVLILGGKNS